MNRIEIVNDIIKDISINDFIECEFIDKDEYNINNLKIKILKSTELEIIYNNDNSTKLNIFIYVNSDVEFNLYERRYGNGTKIQYKYYIDSNSRVNVYKFNYSKFLKEHDIINLNGKGSSINYINKTISTSCEKYDLVINHNSSNTNSNIINQGVNIENGELQFNVSSFVLNNKKNCVVNQVNRIINLTNNKCGINPNLFIDEEDVIANHAALIGRFSDEEMFYLMSRGLKYDSAINLLIKGFLLSNVNDENFKLNITNVVDKYWR